MRASQVIQRLLDLMEVAGCDPDVTFDTGSADEEVLESACFELRWVDPVPEKYNEEQQQHNLVFNMPQGELAIPIRQSTERNEDNPDRVRHYRPGTQIQVISVF